MSQPEPMTPPDCDLRGMPFMPLDVVRLGDSDLFALATGDEFKAAVALWCKSWLQLPAGSLPNDDRILAHLSSAGARWAKVRDMALRGWVECADGRLYHPVVAEKAREAWKHRQAQREKAARRWNKGGGTTDTPEVGTPAASPAALPEQSHGNAAACATAMQGTGTVKKEDTIPRGIAAEVAAVPPSSRDLVWSQGVPLLASLTGKSPSACRSLLGKLLRDLKDDCPKLLLVLQQAQETRPVDPLAWLGAATKPRDIKASRDERILRAAGLWEDDGTTIDHEPRGMLQ